MSIEHYTLTSNDIEGKTVLEVKRVYPYFVIRFTDGEVSILHGSFIKVVTDPVLAEAAGFVSREEVLKYRLARLKEEREMLDEVIMRVEHEINS